MTALELLARAEFWHWWVLGVVLGIMEMLLPGTILLWMGVSAGIVGLVLLVVPTISWEYQWLIFAILSVATILVSWRYLKRHPIHSDHPTLNRRGK